MSLLCPAHDPMSAPPPFLGPRPAPPSQTSVLGPAPGACLVLRAAVPADLAATAALHVDLLPHGLFPRLGPSFLRRWHRAHLRSPEGIATVAVLSAARPSSAPAGSEGARSAEDQIVGFVIGSSSRSRFLATLLSVHRRELAAAGMAALLRRPRTAWYFLRTRSRAYLGRLLSEPAAGAAAAASRGSASAELTAIAVVPAMRGCGVGELLLDAFCGQCRTRGVRRAELVTVAGPAGAASFYRRRGWTAGHVEIARDGSQLQRFHLDPAA